MPWLLSLARLSFDISNSHGLFALVFWMETVVLTLASLAIREYVREITGDDRASSIIGIIFFSTVPFLYFFTPLSRMYYPSDTASIMFIALGLLFLLRLDWAWYYLVLAVGTLNRESTFFLVIAFLATQAGAMGMRQLGKHLTAQVVVFAGVKIGLWFLYGSNGGAGAFSLFHGSEFPQYAATLENSRFFTNLTMFTSAKDAASLTSICCFLLIPSILYGLRLKHRFVKRTLWVIPVFFGMMLFIGNLNEFRIYEDLIPVVLGVVGALVCESHMKLCRLQDNDPYSAKNP
jgi:hypothetical protein